MAEVEVTIRTGTDHAALAALAAGQLEAAGWARRDGGLDGALAWSTWTYAQDGEPYAATLYVLRCPERAGRYKLSLMGEWVGNTGTGQR